MIASLIALVLAGQTAAPSATPLLGAIGKQVLPAKGCAAFLWSAAGDRQLVAMALADPAQIRLSIDGKIADFARTSQVGAGGFGFSDTTEYRGGDVTATLDMTIATRADLAKGASVLQATLRIDRTGKDTIIVPAAGLIGCS